VLESFGLYFCLFVPLFGLGLPSLLGNGKNNDKFCTLNSRNK
jgi:hypothetical protein